ncbi:hypothetical protein FOZ61_002098 [Perkinsus olseni]|uniref:Uncharacterized protein n=1 Tax=Perkinsus olseni TaxID=32597 RepID=A0A7J6LU96_PEROL|nr:hypothetical protein FOZ61_002098 [Perkinsus olseni]KAF4666050.1 hypothetical protein FOL46_003299 [Perkinsus olseni]
MASSKFRLNWLYRSLFCVLCIPQLVRAQVPVVADYPEGCHAGPRSSRTTIHVLSPGSCLYLMRGPNKDGDDEERAGIVIKTNVAGVVGKLKIQVDVVGHSPHYFGTPNVSVETSGFAFLDYQSEDHHIWWYPGPQEMRFTPSDEGYLHVSLPSTSGAQFPRDQQAITHHHKLSGVATSDGVNLFGHTEQTGSSNVPLKVDLKMAIKRVDGGWNYHIGYDARGTYTKPSGVRNTYHYAVNIAKGTLFYPA